MIWCYSLIAQINQSLPQQLYTTFCLCLPFNVLFFIRFCSSLKALQLQLLTLWWIMWVFFLVIRHLCVVKWCFFKHRHVHVRVSQSFNDFKRKTVLFYFPRTLSKLFILHSTFWHFWVWLPVNASFMLALTRVGSQKLSPYMLGCKWTPTSPWLCPSQSQSRH